MYLANFGPPNSPPIALLRRTSNIMIAITAPVQNSVTEKAKLLKCKFVLILWPKQISEENLLSGIDFECRSFAPMVHGRNGPCDTYSKEDVHSITACYIANASVCVFVLNRGYFTGKCIWKQRGFSV